MAGVRIVASFCLMQLICGSCLPGRFGDSCRFLCHCGTSCDVTTGACGADCDIGWSGGRGSNCQKQNVAYHRPASSPIGFQREAWTPDKAVDGDRRQDVATNSCFHPAIPPSPPSQWTVDLGRVYRLHDVRIYNRKEFVWRIRGAIINLHNTSSATGVTCYTFPSDTQEADGVYDVMCDGHGRYLTIRHNTHTLNLCEVEVYVCGHGTYGTNCNHLCGGCSHDTCDPLTGVCPGGCGPEWQGPQCTECRDGRYGIRCDQFCNSRNCITTSSSCDVTGACTDGCRDGWMNTDCRQPCPGSTFGPNCSKSCNSRHCQTPSSSCDHVTGACDGDVCEDGWLGTDCAETCKAGTYWPDCSRCGHCDVTCDVMDGHCPGRCLDGFTGARCHVDTRTQTMSTVRVSSQVMWSMIGGAVGIVVTLLLIGALMMCLLRTGRLSWRSADVNQPVKMSDVIDGDTSTEESQQADSEAGVTDNVYSGLDDVTKADNRAYDNIQYK
ncbi:multiple epidermal growth factor-like domains protein 11 [Haliotis cracherodii]|uniref:multiple epidermal growth factor-like domains protein 11 n=1 Tax=Haliotis cracherodii TaxID=6455 RepID=UPI0039E95B48